MQNLNPQMSDQLLYVAYNTITDDRLQLFASSDQAAKVALIDKLGYTILSQGDQFVLADADDPTFIESALKSVTFADAVEEVLTASKWKLTEPQELLGGTFGRGFGTEGL